MPLPQPPVALDNVCSVIFENTLYTYSEDAFQSLPLIPGGNWTQLAHGEKVSGGVCVGTTAGFYVVGGKATNKNYLGLQKFTYATGEWETLSPTQRVAQDRQGHGAVYLPASDSILVYAGTKDGTQLPTTETFTIGASAPYTVGSIPGGAIPVIDPLLLPWSASEAVLVGGSVNNRQVFLCDAVQGWRDSGATLAQPLEKDAKAMKAVLVTGDDQSKNLYTFDMSVSPNTVSRTVLVDGSGKPVVNSPRLRRRSRAKRAGPSLTQSDWPEYNSTLAPKATRTNYGLAQGAEGMVVMAGGNQDDVLCIFNARENSWQNATALLEDQKVFAAVASSTSSSSSSTASRPATSSSSLSRQTTLATALDATQTPSSTPTTSAVAAAATGNTGLNTNAILGVIFGVTFGVAILLALIYWCIVKRQARKAHIEAGHARRASGLSSVEKDSIIYANGMARELAGPGSFRGHQQQNSANSFSSMAILMGKVNHNNQQHPPSLKRNPSDQTKRSSTSSIFNKAFKSTISKPIPQTTDSLAPSNTAPRASPPVYGDDKAAVVFTADSAGPKARPLTGATSASEKDDATRRSSGWNKYWSGGSALGMMGFGGGNGNGNGPNRVSGPGLTPNPKRMTVETDRSSEYSNLSRHRMTQDSATVPPLNVYEPRASFSQVTRGSPTIANYNSNIKEGMTGQIERPSSAVSSLSGYSSGIPASVHEAWDPTMMQKPWGANRAPSSAYSIPTNTLTPAAPVTKPQNQSDPPPGVSRQPQLKQAVTSDMSWLNLGN